MTHTLYRIPDLEWKHDAGEIYANTPVGTYLIEVWDNSCNVTILTAEEDTEWDCKSETEAKAQCNAHFRARMARGLVEVQDTKGTNEQKSNP